MLKKKGQRVKINSGGEYFAGGYDNRIATVLEDDSYKPFIKTDTGECISPNDSFLTPVEPSIDNLMVGDVVEGQAKRAKVLFIGNDNFIIIEDSQWYWSKQLLKENGYKVMSPKTTMTIKEAEEKLNAIIIKE